MEETRLNQAIAADLSDRIGRRHRKNDIRHLFLQTPVGGHLAANPFA